MSINASVRNIVATALAALLCAGTASIAFASPAHDAGASRDTGPALVAQANLIGEYDAVVYATAYCRNTMDEVVSYSSELTLDAQGRAVYVVRLLRICDTDWNTLEVDGVTGDVLAWY